MTLFGRWPNAKRPYPIELTAEALATVIELTLPDSFGQMPPGPPSIFPDLLSYRVITRSSIGYSDIAYTAGVSRQLSLIVLVAMLVGKYLNRTPL